MDDEFLDEEERFRLAFEALDDAKRNGAVEMTREDWATILREGLELAAEMKRNVTK